MEAPVTCVRPWGTWEVIEEGNRFKVKRLTVTPGQSISLQKHMHRSEHWVVVEGTAIVFDGSDAKRKYLYPSRRYSQVDQSG